MADKEFPGLPEQSGSLLDAGLLAFHQSSELWRITLANFKTRAKLATRPASSTTDKVPQWNNTSGDLKDGLLLATTVADPGVDTSLVSEQGIREALDLKVTAPAATTSGKVPTWSATSKKLDDGAVVVTSIGGDASDAKLASEQAIREMRMDPWYALDTADFTAAPTAEVYDPSADTYTGVSDWASATAYTLGDWVKPTSSNGFLYICVTAGTSGGGEPAWGTTVGQDTADNTASWRCRKAHVITMDTDLTAVLKPGMPLRYTAGSVFYGFIGDITATRMAVYGGTLLIGTDVTVLASADEARLIQVDFHIPGTYADGQEFSLLNVDTNTQFVWRLGAARGCGFFARNGTDDSTGQPNVNLAKLDPPATYTAFTNEDSGEGVAPGLGNTWAQAPYGTVGNVVVESGDIIEVMTRAATTGDASDLTVTGLFVLV